jgi:hypothetical protein
MSCPPGYTFVSENTYTFKNHMNNSVTNNVRNVCIGPAYANYKLDGSTGGSVLDQSTPIKCPWGIPIFDGTMSTAVDTVAAVTTGSAFGQLTGNSGQNGIGANSSTVNNVTNSTGATCAGASILGSCVGASVVPDTVRVTDNRVVSSSNSNNVSIAKTFMPSSGLFVGDVHCQYVPNTTVVGGYDGATK